MVGRGFSAGAGSEGMSAIRWSLGGDRGGRQGMIGEMAVFFGRWATFDIFYSWRGARFSAKETVRWRLR